MDILCGISFVCLQSLGYDQAMEHGSYMSTNNDKLPF